MGNITVSNLGKAYKQYPTRWSRLREWITLGKRQHHSTKWVLQDINFAVQPGEAVGIIGINGAGKSTLLKLITGTTQPTTGRVHMTGRVAAMLELGMGFHPDFTGRQNAFMAGQLLGISNQDMVRLMPEIEAFAEIGDYIDQPVRVYSSGMQMRLAFSVATAIRPDILIVDEALSVGDAYFQHKSLDRIRRYQRDGMTLLLVSHDKQVIQNFCSRAILLDSGRVGVEGDPEKVMDLYDVSIRNLNNHHISVQSEKSGKARIDSGSKDMVIVSIDLRNLVGESVRTLSVGETYICVINARSMNFIENLILGFGVKDKYGQMIFGTNTLNLKKAPREINANELVVFEVSFVAALGLGSFSIHCSLIDKKNGTYNVCHWVDRALLFDVINIDKPDFVGVGWAEIDVTSPVFFVKRGCNE